ncbi:FKBP-type peptidyl-prolyl cis-trans isomerase [Frondihabitans australicus]|uniref:Peptidyl-prolyl cis-trans isomerase n=1 Tax=Frondihabitans australicus TaxID=386892 RepID=A0A495IFN9_9MICO|nr:FKBP-type peptidyl-prolyl cis-trans isomerase [Frondihabitans australicus]RKR74238.1 FKBP-type peptidyl-prolyl isomerase-like protein [Frondihabitans australicus]
MPSFKLTKAIATAAAIGALVSLSLAGCTSSSTTSAGCTGMSSGSASDSVKVSGSVGKAPTVKFSSKSVATKTSQKTTVVTGKGAVVKKNDVVVFGVSLYDGKTEKKAVSYTKSYLVTQKSTQLAALINGLECSRVGDRIVIAGSAKDSTNGKGISSYNIGAKDSVVFVADVLKAFPARATGTKEKPVAGQPTVKLGSDGTPTITIPKGTKAPSSTVATTLIKGSGAKVKSGDTVMVQYTGALFSNGKVFDSSWSRKQPTALAIADGQVISGWVKGLVGKPLGSQVLLVIPAKDGYGSTAQSSIPANSTLVFVVDLLGKVS